MASIELDKSRALWPQVFEILARRIMDGTYGPGERVPSVIAMTEEFGVTSVTARKAIKALRDANLIRTETGMGSYVLTEAEREAGSTP